MSRHRAVLTMIAVTLLWSMAGVVTRQLERAAGYEVTFWRSAATAVALPTMLLVWRGPGWLASTLRRGGGPLWASAACWSVMFTAFMHALTLTTVANVLVTTAAGPVFTAVLARYALGHRAHARTWAAIAVATLGLAVMYAREVAGGEPRHVQGVLVALAVPVGGAVNLILIQRSSRVARSEDLLPAVGLGAVLSALATLPLAWPLGRATPIDVTLLAGLGVFQLALPCLLLVRVASVLDAPRVALLSLLEVLFGVAWTWLAGGEEPRAAVIVGGALVLAAAAWEPMSAVRGERAVAR